MAPRQSSVARLNGDTFRLADRLQLTGGNEDNPEPSDPMTLTALSGGILPVFRPVGLEGAFNTAGGESVLFLPLASGNINTTYEGVVANGLRHSLDSALRTLWNAGAVETASLSPPDLGKRELWLAGHSQGNLSMWDCAQKNANDVARIISHEASPFKDNLAGGIGVIASVAAARQKIAKSLDVFAIVTPNTSQKKSPPPPSPWIGLDDDTDHKLRATKASVTVLPDFSQRESFWRPVPPSAPKTFVQYFLSQWHDDKLATSAEHPANWRFLFFHEMAVFGGDLVPSPTPGGSPSVRTFFEQALGAPNPRPPLP